MTKKRMTLQDLLDEITSFLAMILKLQNCVRDSSGAPFFRLFSRRKRAGTNSPTLLGHAQIIKRISYSDTVYKTFQDQIK
ncbi:hypothetical protein [Flavobacterium sp. DSR2-3-3]|uniref:hypothetical protein n=1 Tax=Flavobacterium sp. DSR2-3-3 TaxID=2804632 RepID=UPI003CF78454